jgi:hypothetical protein
MDDRDTRCAAGAWAHDTFQCYLASAAYARHGTVTGLKGVIHELIYVIRHNLQLSAVARNGFAYLNPDTHHRLYDVLFTGRTSGVQLKDTISATGIRETARRASDYGNILLGTRETVEAAAKRGLQINSSGVSSSTNAGIAARAGCTGSISRAALLSNMKSGAMSAALFSAALALWNGYQRVSEGEATWGEVVADVLRDLIIGGVSGAAAACAGTMVLVMVTTQGDLAIWLSLLVALVVGALVSIGLNALWDDNNNNMTPVQDAANA